jgi:UPF0271 protein
MRVDLNCDLGEGMPNDEELAALATSVSVACGLHAGDPATMRRTVAAALAAGAAVGAHPGYADRAGFGRTPTTSSPPEVRDLVLYQVGALHAFVTTSGARLQHVKPHGALYNQAAADRDLADAVARATAALVPDAALVGPAGSSLETAARAAGLRFAAEVFADRGYDDDGRLVPRGQPGAHADGTNDELAARAVDMVRLGRVVSVSGRELALRADTICLHGDDPRAPALGRAIRAALLRAGVALVPLGALA